MKSQLLLETHSHKWIYFGRDPDKPDGIIDTNQYMLVTAEQALLMDPGGIELFAPMLANVVCHIPIEQLTHLFASHQDPDIISSLGLWDQTLERAQLHAPWIWEGFIRHFGMEHIQYQAIKDQGGKLTLDGVEVQFIPAHYLHASGNFHVYDPVGKVLMSGDIGAALEDTDAGLFVDDFGRHTEKMRFFHQRWMPSNRAKQDWIARVRELELDYLCPQHGRIFRGEQIPEFLDWFERLEVGVAVTGN
ncbi:MBL fold metallo-hydrolase [Shewanella algae]|uniref:MBL fold metallo-hydrolase n=1 Tax=Shewanella carassii TaxID=1987584 RepID=A0ABQ1SYD6_9GAMM|nr:MULTISPECIES: MBL fold metallo-hydrolase [Shewanella]MBO2692667.1 MBL fold metallo-hydrolase [Shewanella algae]TVP09589.1 flavoprotein [Shewanella sp. MSW]GGE69004.1 MBL fold metallo-hydrolase [Shewanella carassii]